MPSNYLNQWWNIVNWTLGNKLQWNFNRNSNIFIHENAFENVVCEMGSICLGFNVLTSPIRLSNDQWQIFLAGWMEHDSFCYLMLISADPTKWYRARNRSSFSEYLLKIIPHIRGNELVHFTAMIVQWNLSITTTWWDTFLPSGAHLGGPWPELQKAEIVSKSKLVPSVFIKSHYWTNQR